MEWQIRLITIYIYICSQYDKDIWVHCQRFTNNDNPLFADEEVITLFLYGIMQRRFKIGTICDYAGNHLSDWSPRLPSYVAFVNRLNRLSDVFPVIMERIISDFSGTLPVPDHIGVTPASVHDLTAFHQIMPYLKNCEIYADKAYVVSETERQLLREQGTEILTLVRKKKGQQTPELSDRLLPSCVSGIRQPIESLFNRIQEKTNIEMASKVRSRQGLMVHIFGRLAAAMFMLVFDS